MGILLGLVIAAVFYVWARQQQTNTTKRVYPPGPKPLWLIGNILDLTARELWLRVTNWSNQFGKSLPLSYPFATLTIMCIHR